MFEYRKTPLISHTTFVLRMLRSFVYGLLTVATVVGCGAIGFHYIEKVAWIDAFLEASMFFGGMGSEFVIQTWWGKFFAAVYAILCPFGLVAAITILLLPLLHRFMHKFHIDIEKH